MSLVSSLFDRIFLNFLQQRVVVHFFQRQFFYLGSAFGAKVDDRLQSCRRNVGNPQSVILNVLFVRRVEGFAVVGPGVFTDGFLGEDWISERQVVGRDRGAQNFL
jgi:hypothetical protein